MGRRRLNTTPHSSEYLPGCRPYASCIKGRQYNTALHLRMAYPIEDYAIPGEARYELHYLINPQQPLHWPLLQLIFPRQHPDLPYLVINQGRCLSTSPSGHPPTAS